MSSTVTLAVVVSSVPWLLRIHSQVAPSDLRSSWNKRSEKTCPFPRSPLWIEYRSVSWARNILRDPCFRHFITEILITWLLKGQYWVKVNIKLCLKSQKLMFHILKCIKNLLEQLEISILNRMFPTWIWSFQLTASRSGFLKGF